MGYLLRPIIKCDEEVYLSLFWSKELCSKDLLVRIRAEFHALISMPGLDCTAVTDSIERPVGFVITGFLRPAFEQLLRKSLEPDIVPKLIKHDAVITTDRELGIVNATGNLVGTVITFGFSPTLSVSEAATVKNELMNRAVVNFCGFNLSEIMIEAHSEGIMIELAKGGFKKVNSYDLWWKANGDTRPTCPALMTVTRHDAQNGLDYHLLRMFVFGNPQFHFSFVERELLTAALSGLTDIDIADELGIGKDAVKGRWKSIYRKAEILLGNDLKSQESEKRSREKKRKVLDFVRSRPQELRPYYPS